MFFRHGKQVIDGFKVARLNVLAGLLNCLFHRLLQAIHRLCYGTRHFNFFRDFFVEEIDTRHIGEKIKREFCIVTQECRYFDRVFRLNTQRMLSTRAAIVHDSYPCARYGRLDCCLDLLNGFHYRITTGTVHTPGFEVGSRSCSPCTGTGNSPCASAFR